MTQATTQSRLAAVVLAVATAAAGLLASTGSGAGAAVGQQRFARNVRLGADPEAVRVSDAVGLAANPADPNQVVAVTIDVLRDRCEYRVSVDAGATWDRGVLRVPAGFPAQPCTAGNSVDGGLAWGSGQNVYASFASQKPGENPAALVVRSTDGGRTFAPAVVAMPGAGAGNPTHNRPELVVIPGGGTAGADRVYVGAGGTGGSPRITGAWVARSDDGGATWSAPVNASIPANEAVLVNEVSQPQVGPNGELYIAWRTSAGVPTGFVWVAKSVDLGATWTAVKAAAVRGYGPDAAGSTFNGSTFPRLAVDARSGAGNVYVVYMQGGLTPRQDHFIHPDVDVGFVRSTDGGATWSTPLRVNDDPGPSVDPGVEGIAQRHPQARVAADGRLDIVWQDRRHGYRSPTNSHLGNGEARFGDTYYAYTTDGGLTFSPNRRVSDESQNLDLGLDYRTGAYWNYAGSLTHLGPTKVMFGWMDSREASRNTDSMDIYLSTIDLAASGEVPFEALPELANPAMSAALSQRAYLGGPQSRLNVGFTSAPVTQVVVVNQADAGLAAAAGVLARATLGPLLLSPSFGLPDVLKLEVSRMEPIGALVVGDEAALSEGLVADLVDLGIPRDKVVRLSGGDAAGTARAVALAMDRRTDTARAQGIASFDAAVVVNPATPEAATAAAMAASLRYPVLFSGTDSVPAATLDAISTLNLTNTLIVGGTAAISDAAAAQLPAVQRLSGADAAAVSEAVLVESVARGLPRNIVYVTDSAQPIDAAVLGYAVGKLGGLALAVPGADVAMARSALGRLGQTATVDRIVVLKGTGVGTGNGYRLVGADGGVFAFGDAAFFRPTGAVTLNQPVVGLAPTPTGGGYWLAAADGGVFAFGDANFFGSTGSMTLNRPVVGIAPTPSGNGYWLAAADGGLFTFGDAGFFGSTGSMTLNQPVAGIASTPSGNGYWFGAGDGGVFAFGDAGFFGSAGGLRLGGPVVGIAAA
ncbi:MAG: cell wall-binding repeat-containing protein [Acidimicrobiales bacterium]